MYALEAVELDTSTRNSLEFVFNSVYAKIFNVKDKLTILLCIHFTENLSANCLMDLRKLSFYASISNLFDSQPFLLNKLVLDQEESNIYIRYSIPQMTPLYHLNKKC